MTEGIWGIRQVARWWRRRRRRLRLSQVQLIASATQVPGKLAAGEAILVGTHGALKWLVLGCPCRCGEVHWVSLMPSDRKRWSAVLSEAGLLTVDPSLWSATHCRSHFWIREGRVDWC